MGAIELTPAQEPPPLAPLKYFRCYEKGVLIRTTGDIIALTPSLIVEKEQIDHITDTIRQVLATVD